MTHQGLIVWPRNKLVTLSPRDLQILLQHHSLTFPDTATDFKHQYVRDSILQQLWETQRQMSGKGGQGYCPWEVYTKNTHIYQTYTCFGHEMRFPFLSTDSLLKPHGKITF